MLKTEKWTPCLSHAKQALYHMSYIPFVMLNLIWFIFLNILMKLIGLRKHTVGWYFTILHFFDLLFELWFIFKILM